MLSDFPAQIGSPSIERLIDASLRLRLFTDYEMTPEAIVFRQDDREYTFDPEQARCFLLGLLYGYSRAQTPPVAGRVN